MKLSNLATASLAALVIAVAIGGCLASPRANGSGEPGSGTGPGDGQASDASSSTTAGGGGGGAGGASPVDGSGGGSGGGSAGGAASGSDPASSSSTATSSPATSASGTTSASSGGGAGPAPVSLGTASTFVILAKSGITTTGTTSLTGDLGVSPIAGTAITGFTLVMDASNEFATSPIVTGKVYAADYASPTPAKLTQAISDMQTASNDAAGRTAVTANDLGAGSIGGMTFQPGLYKWSTGVLVGSDIVLSGGPNDVWIFQIAQTLDVATGVHVTLQGGAQAGNVYWQVGEQVTLGTYCDFKGNLITQTAIVFNTGATLVGRALAGTAVTLDANTLTKAA